MTDQPHIEQWEPVYTEPAIADSRPVPPALSGPGTAAVVPVEQRRPGLMTKVKALVHGQVPEIPTTYARLRRDGSMEILAEKPRVPDPIPDEVGLPEGYTGVRPPAGWCTPGRTYVEPQLRAAYLDELNDSEAERTRRDEMFQSAESMFSTPGDVTEHDVAADRKPPTHIWYLHLNDPALRELWMHSRRYNAAYEVAIELPKQRATAELMQSVYLSARTCTVCAAKSVLPMDSHPLLFGGESPVCSTCRAVADQMMLSLQAGTQIDTDDGPKRRDEIIGNQLRLPAAEEWT